MSTFGVNYEFDPNGNKFYVIAPEIVEVQKTKEQYLGGSIFPLTEGSLYEEICKNSYQKLRNEIRKRATALAFQNGEADFIPSINWLDSFIKRFSLSCTKKTVHHNIPKVKSKYVRGQQSHGLLAKASKQLSPNVKRENTVDLKPPKTGQVLHQNSNEKSSNQLDSHVDNGLNENEKDSFDNGVILDKHTNSRENKMENGPVKDSAVSSIKAIKKEKEPMKRSLNQRSKLTSDEKSQNVTEDSNFTIALDNEELINNSLDDSVNILEKTNFNDSSKPVSSEIASSDTQVDLSPSNNLENEASSNKDENNESDSEERLSEDSSTHQEEDSTSSEDDQERIINNLEKNPHGPYSKEDNKFYKHNYEKLLNRLQEKLIQCTVCSALINHNLSSEVFVHPHLKVILCKKCFNFYDEGEFKKDENGYDEYCRWCANGGELFLCDKCTNAFCKKCVKKNIGRSYERELSNTSSWNCFICDESPLVELRMLVRMIDERANRRKNKNERRKFKNENLSREVSNEVVFISDARSILQDAITQLKAIERNSRSKDSSERSNQISRRFLRWSNVLQENLKTVNTRVQTANAAEGKVKTKVTANAGSQDLKKNRNARKRVREPPIDSAKKKKPRESIKDDDCSSQPMVFIRSDLFVESGDSCTPASAVEQENAISEKSADDTVLFKEMESSNEFDSQCLTENDDKPEDELNSTARPNHSDSDDNRMVVENEDPINPPKRHADSSNESLDSLDTKGSPDKPASVKVSAAEKSENNALDEAKESLNSDDNREMTSDEEREKITSPIGKKKSKKAADGRINEPKLDGKEISSDGPPNKKRTSRLRRKNKHPNSRENKEAMGALLNSGSDLESESKDSSGKKRPKKKMKKRSAALTEEQLHELAKEAQMPSYVKIDKLSADVIEVLDQDGFVDLEICPHFDFKPLKSDESETEFANVLKFTTGKATGRSKSRESSAASSESEDEPSKTDKKCSTRPSAKKKKKEIEGLLDINADAEVEADGEEGGEEELIDGFSKRPYTPLGENDHLKSALLMSSDESGHEGNTQDSDSDDLDEKHNQEMEEKKRKKYQEEKMKEKESKEAESGNEGDTEEEAEFSPGKKSKKGYLKFQFSSSENEEDLTDEEDQEEERAAKLSRKSRMCLESGSESDNKNSKLGLFDEPSESEYSSESSDEKSKDKKKKNTRKRVRRLPSSSEDEAAPAKEEDTPSKKKRRRIISDEDLLQSTKAATQEEQDRRERVKERQNRYNKIFEVDVEADQMDLKNLVLDFDESTKEELVKVDSKLLGNLKPHQVSGIRFMWDATIESLSRLEKGEKGGGCILAHCMGLGKTLQVITFVHTLLTTNSVSSHIRRVLVCCPVNTVYNWVAEFNQWLKGKMLPFDVVELISCKDHWMRSFRLDEWYKEGGVCVIGYDMFRNLTKENKKIKGRMREIFNKSLVSPGPDLVICDEGHILKNEKTHLSVAINKIETMRRIVLTGTPLQNNLKEYHCMIQFVKPNLLGSKKEFMNRFVNPIEAGQCIDAVPKDVRRMKRRAHILHNLLEGCVQRFDYSVLKPFLPPKFEYVISVQLSAVQCKLYSHYLQNLAQGGPKRASSGLFVDFNNLSRVWSHPAVLYLALKRKEEAIDFEEDTEGDLTDFIDDGSDSSSGDDSAKRKKKKGAKSKKEEEPKTDVNGTDTEVKIEEPKSSDVPGLSSEGKVRPNWWRAVLERIGEEIGEKDYDEDTFLNRIEIGGKMFLLIDILRECSVIGDKVLLFSQSILVLDMIENFLYMLNSGELKFNGKKGEDDALSDNLSWEPNKDYLRLDGSVSADTRKNQCNYFNNPKNDRCRLFLISTRAGGIGINLIGANRVIIFDSSWNPSHDTQSIFRVYRFGQKKPCYIYRFVAQGTMEEKIYSRQVTKISTSLRVVDEHQIKRYFKTTELSELYEFSPADVGERETPVVPEDRLLAELLIRNKDVIVKYHEQDSLLENQTGEELTEEERKAAWEDYENEKEGKKMVINSELPGQLSSSIQRFNLQSVMDSIIAEYPNAQITHVRDMTRQVVMQMQKIHLTHFKKLQGILYNMKNPMIAPEIARQMGGSNQVQMMNNMREQAKILEENIQSEDRVIQQLSRLGNYSDVPSTANVGSSSGTVPSSHNVLQYVNRIVPSSPQQLNKTNSVFQVRPLANRQSNYSNSSSSTQYQGKYNEGSTSSNRTNNQKQDSSKTDSSDDPSVVTLE